MTKLEKMWTALEAYQPTADKKGYGVAWSRMCSERTADAADAAADYAAASSADAAADAAHAADARAAAHAAAAARAAAYVARANEFAEQSILNGLLIEQSIYYITIANEDLTQCF